MELAKSVMINAPFAVSQYRHIVQPVSKARHPQECAAMRLTEVHNSQLVPLLEHAGERRWLEQGTRRRARACVQLSFELRTEYSSEGGSMVSTRRWDERRDRRHRRQRQELC